MGETTFCSGTSHSSAVGSAPFFVSGGGGWFGDLFTVAHPCHSAACHKHTIQAPPKLTFAKIWKRSGGGRASMGWQGSWAPEYCRGQTEGCSVNWTVVLKNKQKTIHGELSGTLPLEREQTLFAAYSHDAALVNAHSFVSMRVEARCCPCHSAAHCRHMKRQPSLCHCCCRHGCCHCNPRRHLRCHCRLHCHSHCHCGHRHFHSRHCPLLSPLPIALTVPVTVCHYRCGCCWPLPTSSLSRCRQPWPSPSPLPSVIAVSVTVGHRSCHLCRPSPSLSPLVISESCCLGAARIVFEQFKQRMLTLFYFVRTVSGALIKAGWLTRRRAAIANTSIGWQVVSSKRLVGEVAGSRGAAGGQQVGDITWPWEVLFVWVVGVAAVDRWRLWWCVGCGRRHCWWNSN